MARRSFLYLLIMSAIWAGAGAGASAEAPAGPAAEGAANQWLLARYDFNGDRVISADEISYRRERLFGSMDGDADGVVSLDEYQALDARRRSRLLEARYLTLDLDADGELTADEYSSYMGSFDRFDRDGDGHVTRKEMAGSRLAAAGEDAGVEQPETHCLLWLCIRTGY